jgi:hypothetical protein
MRGLAVAVVVLLVGCADGETETPVVPVTYCEHLACEAACVVEGLGVWGCDFGAGGCWCCACCDAATGCFVPINLVFDHEHARSCARCP